MNDNDRMIEVYEQHKPQVRKQAGRAFQFREDIEDVVSEVFLRVWKYKHNLPKIENMAAWINRITHTVICDHIRNRAKHNHLSLEPIISNDDYEISSHMNEENILVSTNNDFISKDALPDTALENQEIMQMIEKALNDLVATHKGKIKGKTLKAAWKLRFIDKFTTKEIAGRYKTKPDIIRAWNRNTTKYLKEYLQTYYERDNIE